MLVIPLLGTAGVITKSCHPPPPHRTPPLPAAHRRPRALLCATQCSHVAQPTYLFQSPSRRSSSHFSSIGRDYAAQAAQSALDAKSGLFASVETPKPFGTPLRMKTRRAAAQSSFVPIFSMAQIGTSRAIFGVMGGVVSSTARSNSMAPPDAHRSLAVVPLSRG
jgi:hypothetical protein